MAEIVLIEDDATLALSLETRLTLEGHVVHVASTIEDGRQLLERRVPQLMVLDLGLPDGDGLDFLVELRASGVFMPVLVLTARGTLEARIEGLNRGADDYLPKPFNIRELLARVDALLRRTKGPTPTDELVIGRLRMNLLAHTATSDGEDIPLTALEFRLLQYLDERRGEAVSRQDLLQAVWGLADGVQTRTVDVFVSRLRKVIEEDVSHPKHLISVRGVGYRLEP